MELENSELPRVIWGAWVWVKNEREMEWRKKYIE
jgi:hypothetical protein